MNRWHTELSCYSFDIVYRSGKENVVADFTVMLLIVMNFITYTHHCVIQVSPDSMHLFVLEIYLIQWKMLEE